MIQLGIEKLLQDRSLVDQLKGRRVAILAHPASVDQNLRHSLDLLMSESDIQITCAFGPQHGMRGEKQDNMIESDDYRDPDYNIPVYSLYGRVRRPTDEMLADFDILLVDLQDVGCRIYTFLTTLFYMIDALNERSDKELWVLDRPNPAGRSVEGLLLDSNYHSFVGAAPVPMRHGLTLGEAGQWYIGSNKMAVNYQVIPMKGYNPEAQGEWGWPGSLSWVNPSPNLPRWTGTHIYAGSVMIEGTHISEGRGTTIPLEAFGAPDIDSRKVLSLMHEWAPEWLRSCIIRPCFFEPTFHKHAHKLVNALQVHIDVPGYAPHAFQPFRLVSLYFRALRYLYPNYKLWKQPPYEYEEEKLPIDILSGSDELRLWVDGQGSIFEWEQRLSADEQKWTEERKPFLIYEAARS